MGIGFKFENKMKRFFKKYNTKQKKQTPQTSYDFGNITDGGIICTVHFHS